jgi:rubrerythrin
MVGGQIADDKLKDIKMYGQALDPDEKEVYSHESRVRCGKCISQKVFSVGTIWEGRLKRWRCRTCGHKFKTQGKKI